MPLLLLALFISLFQPAQAAKEVRGRVFYEPLSSTEPSFFFKSVETSEGTNKQVISIYSDKDGKELVREENYFKDGELERSVYDQKQVNEKGEVVFREGKAHFTFTDHEGTESDTEDREPNMILGSMIGPHLYKHWNELMKGDSVKVRYMAIERVETIGFKFFKDGERLVGNTPGIDITMKPSSFIIAALVKPVRITVKRDEPRYILEVEGRTPIRWPKEQPPKSRKDWKAIDARIEFDPPKTVADPEKAPEASPKPAATHTGKLD